MVEFLHDIPADEDFFQTHSAIARAIVKAISTDDRIRVVGLIGSWGSGKSTVIRQLSKIFSDDTAFENYVLYEYDTWLHQNDPPRRAFMESLIDHLTEEGLLKKDVWESRLRKLKGELDETITTKTPILTWKSVALLKSYLIATVGLFVLNKVSLEKLSGGTASRLETNLFVFGLMLVAIVPLAMLAIAIRERFVEKLKPEERSVVPRLLNKEIESHRQTTARLPEPTSIEFRDAFGEIVDEVRSEKKRLILVLDNIDRLSDEDALAQWVTLRGFFVDRRGRSFATTNGPVAVVPVDLSSISRIFAPATAGGGSPEEFAQSYLDKTFDVVFSVREPAPADWRTFFDQSFSTTIGDLYGSREIHDARRLYEAFLSKHNRKTTPRAIVRLANQVAAMALEVPVTVPLPTLCLYALYKRDIDNGIAAFVSEGRDFSNFDPDWKLNLASIHFLVERKKAVAPLLREELVSIIAAADMPRAAAYLDIEGVGDLLVDIARNPPTDERGLISLKSTAFLTDFVKEHGPAIHGSGHWRDELDSELFRMFQSVAPSQSDIAGLASTLHNLSAQADDQQAARILDQGQALLQTFVQGEKLPQSAVPAVANALDQLATISAQRGLPEPQIEGPSDTSQALMRQLILSEASAHWRMMKGPTDKDKIQEVLSAMLRDATRRRLVDDLIGMLRQNDDQKLALSGDDEEDQLAGTLDELLRDATQVDALPVVLRSTALLGMDSEPIQEMVTSWSDDGILTARLADAISTANIETIAALLAIGIEMDVYFNIPPGTDWPEGLLAPAGGRMLLNQLTHRTPSFQRVSIWNGIKKWPNAKAPLLNARDRFIDDTDPEALDPAYLLGRVRSTILEVGNAPFYHLISRHSKFEEALADADVENLLDILELSNLAPHARAAANRFLREKAIAADADCWTGWLVEGSRLFGRLDALDRVEPIRISRRQGAAAALERSASVVVQDRAALKRWRTLAIYAIGAAADRALDELLEALATQQDAHRAIADLKSLGNIERAIERRSPAWADFLDRMIDYDDGRRWIKDNVRGVRAFIRGLSDDNVSRLYGSIERMTHSKQVIRSNWAREALGALFDRR